MDASSGGGGPREAGLAVLGLLGPLLAVLLVALVVVVDAGGLALATSRAQAAADGAALAAAVAAHPDHHPVVDPARAARSVAVAAGGELVRCACQRGRGPRVVVVVRMPVGGLVLPRVWSASVDARAEAEARPAPPVGPRIGTSAPVSR